MSLKYAEQHSSGETMVMRFILEPLRILLQDRVAFKGCGVRVGFPMLRGCIMAGHDIALAHAVSG